MPSVFPEGRVGTLRFCQIAGISWTIFMTRFRHDPKYKKLFDIHEDALGRLNMSESAAVRFGEQRKGRPAHGNCGRFKGRPCPDPACPATVANRADTCRTCGFAIRWRCTACGIKSRHDDAVCQACGELRQE